jgi:5-methylcytosine-specific restriction endonuclease McrA
MSSALRPGGSTARWRKIRALILQRDGFRCQVETPSGLCGAYADVCGHVTPRTLWPAGQDGIDSYWNLRSECRKHSVAGGTALRHDLERRGREAIAARPTRNAWRNEPPEAWDRAAEKWRENDARTPPAPVAVVDPVPVDEEPGVF